MSYNRELKGILDIPLLTPSYISEFKWFPVVTPQARYRLLSNNTTLCYSQVETKEKRN